MIDKSVKIPLYKQICNELKEKILGNEYKNGEFLPSERELSNYYEVERATTRRALDLLVKERLLIKIPGAGTKVNYSSCPEIANIEYNSIAFILPSNTSDKITQPFIAEIFYNIEKECKKANYSLFYTKLHSDDDLPDIVLKKNVKGIIWVSNVEDEFIFKSKELGIPSILISNYIQGFTSILIDNIGGSCEAVQFLINAGHKKIAFINGISGYLNSIERFEGLKRAIYNSPIEFNEKLIKESDWTFEGGYLSMKSFMDTPIKPTAVFASNDMMALGAMKAIQEAGLSVPDDISVIGFDNIEQCKYSNPSLTTVGTDMSLIARQSMKHLLELGDDFDTPAVKIIIPANLIVRDSVTSIRNLNL